ncbi:MerR family transcriptional regulator [Maribacter stanieri]|uniref:MerR family transcriptional regulator n=1 Tax=Maribacter stanieri TaxID=440514 RepID=UPI002494E419|nr:MerR family transcriptional regulator [Maribacter stanieri]
MKEIEDLRGHLLNHVFNKKDLTVSYRTVNHYDSMGVLIGKRTSSKKWRKFNAIELIWIELVVILREIGMPLLKILKLKDKIFNEGKIGSIDKANFINKSFEDEIILSIIKKYDLYILVFNDCNFTFHDSVSLQQWHNGIYKNEPHVNVPLSNIILESLNKLKNL